MPSTAYTHLENRLEDIEQLLDAHSAITRFKKAERAAQDAGGELRNIADIIDALVTNPGRGRPSEVDALNRAGFVLLCSHLQGFIDDLHLEVARVVLQGKVGSIEDTVKLIKPRNSNPHVDIINKMFAGLGIYDLMDRINWQKCNNSTVKDRLKNYITIRNKIAHGEIADVTKQKLQNFKKFVITFANRLEYQIGRDVQRMTGNNPW